MKARTKDCDKKLTTVGAKRKDKGSNMELSSKWNTEFFTWLIKGS